MRHWAKITLLVLNTHHSCPAMTGRGCFFSASGLSMSPLLCDWRPTYVDGEVRSLMVNKVYTHCMWIWVVIDHLSVLEANWHSCQGSLTSRAGDTMKAQRRLLHRRSSDVIHFKYIHSHIWDQHEPTKRLLSPFV